MKIHIGDKKFAEVREIEYWNSRRYKWLDYHRTKIKALAQARRLKDDEVMVHIKHETFGGYSTYTHVIK